MAADDLSFALTDCDALAGLLSTATVDVVCGNSKSRELTRQALLRGPSKVVDVLASSLAAWNAQAVCPPAAEGVESPPDSVARLATAPPPGFEFLPEVLWTYLSNVARQHRKDVASLEALILAWYNKCVSGQQLRKKDTEFRVAALEQPSVFHEPLSTERISAKALRQLGSAAPVAATVTEHSVPLSRIPASLRPGVVSVLTGEFSSQMHKFSKDVIEAYCEQTTKIASAGFPMAPIGLQAHPRVSLPAENLIRFGMGMHTAVFQCSCKLGLAALHVLEARARADLLPAAMMMLSSATHAVEDAAAADVGRDGGLRLSFGLLPYRPATAPMKEANKRPGPVPASSSQAADEGRVSPRAPVGGDTGPMTTITEVDIGVAEQDTSSTQPTAQESTSRAAGVDDMPVAAEGDGHLNTGSARGIVQHSVV
eukprot:m.18849 g.18849  ORF g.18849 m.18849 type:complete len:426 (-) comp5800_c0_seq1:304-1581(-)